MPDSTAQPPALVADIGGTNSRFVLTDGMRLRSDTIRRYANADQTGIGPLLRHYMDDVGIRSVGAVCIAIAGQIRGDSATMTNRDWHIDRKALRQITGADTALFLNDLQAQGYALGHLAPDSQRLLLAGAPPPAGASQLIVGIGTGFNVAPVHFQGARHVVASESGHITLPVRDLETLQLARALADDTGFAEVEHVLSGPGLVALYHYLGKGRPARAPADITAALAAGDPRAEAAMRQFVRLLGIVIGDQALIHLPFGGIALIGGVARAVAPWLERFDFAAHFRDKGRFSPFMQNFPVSLIADDYAALLGGAHYLELTLGMNTV